MVSTKTKEISSSAEKNGSDLIFTKTHDILKDEVAKVMFTDDEILDYTKKLICMILDIDEKWVEKLELAPEYVNQNFDIKGSVGDIIYSNDYYYINLEFNASKGRNRQLKNLKYVFHLVLNQMKKDSLKRFDDLRKVVQINFNAYDRYGLKKLLYSSHIADDESHIIDEDFIQFFDINLEIAKDLWYTKGEKESLEYYLFAISSRDYNTKYKMYEGDRLMESVVDKMDDLRKEFNDDLFYDNEELLKRDSYDMGKKEGIEEGIKQGIEQGIEQGKEEGINENKIMVAKKMIEEDFDMKIISKITELSIEEIEQLKKYMIESKNSN